MQVTLTAAALAALWAHPAGAGAQKEPKAVKIDATVEAVMETDPLQLTVTVKAGGKEEKYAVLLTDKTEVTLDGKPAKPGDLRPKQAVRIHGTAPGEKRVTATKIEIGKPK